MLRFSFDLCSFLVLSLLQCEVLLIMNSRISLSQLLLSVLQPNICFSIQVPNPVLSSPVNQCDWFILTFTSSPFSCHLTTESQCTLAPFCIHTKSNSLCGSSAAFLIARFLPSFWNHFSNLQTHALLCPYLLNICDSSLGFVPVSAGQDHPGSPLGQVQSCGFTDAGIPPCSKTT